MLRDAELFVGNAAAGLLEGRPIVGSNPKDAGTGFYATHWPRVLPQFRRQLRFAKHPHRGAAVIPRYTCSRWVLLEQINGRNT
jgi:hypothetical protein